MKFKGKIVILDYVFLFIDDAFFLSITQAFVENVLEKLRG